MRENQKCHGCTLAVRARKAERPLVAPIRSFVLGAFLLAHAAAGAGLSEGMAQLQKRNFNAAYNEFHPLALSGVAQAQYQLALLLEQGNGVPRNRATALRWMLAAADAGLAEAQYGAWRMLSNNVLSTESDVEEARKWLERAAQSEHPDAIFTLYLQRNESSDPSERSEALKALELAARNGHVAAQREWALHLLASSSKHPPYALAAYWLGRSADAGDALAQVRLANLLSAGLGVERDAKRAARLYADAASQGQVEALNELGLLFSHGRSVAKASVPALAFFTLASELDNTGKSTAHAYRRSEMSGLSASQIEEAKAMSEALLRNASIKRFVESHLKK